MLELPGKFLIYHASYSYISFVYNTSLILSFFNVSLAWDGASVQSGDAGRYGHRRGFILCSFKSRGHCGRVTRTATRTQEGSWPDAISEEYIPHSTASATATNYEELSQWLQQVDTHFNQANIHVPFLPCAFQPPPPLADDDDDDDMHCGRLYFTLSEHLIIWLMTYV